MIIDCQSCSMRQIACHDCVVSVLLGPPQELAGAERSAIAVLANGGLVPPLRLVRGARRREGGVAPRSA